MEKCTLTLHKLKFEMSVVQFIIDKSAFYWGHSTFEINEECSFRSFVISNSLKKWPQLLWPSEWAWVELILENNGITCSAIPRSRSILRMLSAAEAMHNSRYVRSTINFLWRWMDRRFEKMLILSNERSIPLIKRRILHIKRRLN